MRLRTELRKLHNDVALLLPLVPFLYFLQKSLVMCTQSDLLVVLPQQVPLFVMITLCTLCGPPMSTTHQVPIGD